MHETRRRLLESPFMINANTWKFLINFSNITVGGSRAFNTRLLIALHVFSYDSKCNPSYT